jgi:hypothetical protein
MKKNAPKLGESVISHFRSHWKGVILDIEKYPSTTICTVLIIKDRNGNTPRKRILRKLSIWWLTECEVIDTSHINKDWFDF